MRVVVIGAGYAGLLAALRLKGRTARFAGNAKAGSRDSSAPGGRTGQPGRPFDSAGRADGAAATPEVTVVAREPYFTERIRLHQAIGGRRRPVRHELEGFLRGCGIGFVQGTVERIAPERRQLFLRRAGDRVIGQAGSVERLGYDRLVYAPGSTVSADSVPGAAEYAYPLNDAVTGELRERLRSSPRGHRAVVVGSGLTGIETAAALAERLPHLKVSVVSADDLAEGHSSAGAAYLYRVFHRLGIELHERRPAAAVEARVLRLEGGESIPFDTCIWTAGFSVPKLVMEAGIAVNEQNRLIVNAQLQSTSHPEIYGAGDAAAFAPGCPVQTRFACATAMPMGAHAAENIANEIEGRAPEPFRFGYFGRCIDLGRRRGLVELVRPDDTPNGTVFTGRLGKLGNDAITAMTWQMLRLERRLPGAYRWPQSIPARPGGAGRPASKSSTAGPAGAVPAGTAATSRADAVSGAGMRTAAPDSADTAGAGVSARERDAYG